MKPEVDKINDCEGGVALWEVLVALSVMSLLAVVSLAFGQRWIGHASLEATSVRMVQDLRFAQESAISSGHLWSVDLSKFSTDYAIYDGGTVVTRVGFAKGVDYHGGYLEMGTASVRYDPMGNAQTSGVIQLDSGLDTSRITLYMGTGLQSLVMGP